MSSQFIPTYTAGAKFLFYYISCVMLLKPVFHLLSGKCTGRQWCWRRYELCLLVWVVYVEHEVRSHQCRHKPDAMLAFGTSHKFMSSSATKKTLTDLSESTITTIFGSAPGWNVFYSSTDCLLAIHCIPVLYSHLHGWWNSMLFY